MDSENSDEAHKIREKRLARLQRREHDSSETQLLSPDVPPMEETFEVSTDVNEGKKAKLEYKENSQTSLPRKQTLAEEHMHRSHLGREKLAEERAVERRAPHDAHLTSLERWEDRVLSDIFQVTVHNNSSRGILYLETLKQDLEEQGQKNRMCLAVVDQAILAVASSPLTSCPPFTYISRCYRRASTLARNLRVSSEAEDKYKADVLKEAKRLCVSYCEFAITCPEMFEGNPREVDLAAVLLKDLDDEEFVPLDLVQELALRFSEEELLKDGFRKALENMSDRSSELEFLDDYKPFINSFARLVSVKAIASLLTESQNFIPKNASIQNIEKRSLLGPLFRLSPLQPIVTKTYFPNPKMQSPSSIDSAINSLRIMSRTHQEQLFMIVNSIVRSSEAARNRMLDYFGLVINLNYKRRALQVDENSVSSDGFLLNVNAVLHKLCEPFMDATYSKVDKIDTKYFRYAPRVDISNETKINADQRGSDEFYLVKLDGRPNFNTEVFYLNVAAYHIGYISSIHNSESLSQALSDMERHMERLRREREKHLNSPHLALLDRNISLLETRIQSGLSYKAILDGILSHDVIHTESMSFLNYLSVWLLHFLSPSHRYPREQYTLPLSDSPPLEFNYFPEYFVENTAYLFTEVIRSYPSRITLQQSENIVVFAITFLRMPSYVKNPYIRAKLVEVLYGGILTSRKYMNGVLGEVLNTLKFSLDNLMHSLMCFYLEVEHHTNFYQKFNIRYHMAQIIKSIWRNPHYRDKLRQESRHNHEFFVRFVALLLNDVTYLLDESLTKLTEIHRLQQNATLSSNTSSEPQPTGQQDREALLASVENQASIYVGLANETVLMVSHFTAAIPDAFVTKELVHRLAGMLNYNLDALVGPKCSNLKVENPQKYRFEPRSLLSEIVSIYLNLKDQKGFVEAIAKDGRSYKPELFVRARNILSKYSLKSSEDLHALERLAELVEGAKKADDEDEEELGDIPDEFLDPLLATIMEEPVILPSSRAVVDLSTIKAHLLSDSKDPFNRAPLKLEDVIPDNDLKTKIKEFILDRKRTGRKVEMDLDN